MIKVWSEVTSSASDITQILESSLWMNADISVTRGKSVPFSVRSKHLHKVKDLLNANNKIATFDEMKSKGLPHGEYLTWMSIISCIPSSWKKRIEKQSVNKVVVPANLPLENPNTPRAVHPMGNSLSAGGSASSSFEDDVEFEGDPATQ